MASRFRLIESGSMERLCCAIRDMYHQKCNSTIDKRYVSASGFLCRSNSGCSDEQFEAQTFNPNVTIDVQISSKEATERLFYNGSA
jgi:hypothetical protein